MFQVINLGIKYGGRTLFSGANFELQKGDRIGFVGRNGSGKSTFFRLITGEEVSDSGTVSIQRHYSIGVLNQHIKFEKETILEEAALGLPPGEEDCIYKAETILFGLGFSEKDLDMPISSFSGGYQLRLHLAKVLISEPDCLLLDEPTNYLDIASIRWFTKFLQQWPGEFILISHDREFMDSVTTHTMGIHREKIRKMKGSTINFYEKIMLEEEIHEKTRINVDKKRAQAQNFIDRFGAKASKAVQAQSRQKMLDRIPILEKLKNINHLDFEFHTAPFPGQKMIDAKNVTFAYEEGKELINDFSLEIEKGERIAIIGKNGRGKSTLLRLLAKELTPTGGTMKHSENLAIGYFGQTHIDRLNPKHSIEEEIATGNPKLNRTEIKSICGLMMFSQDQSAKLNSMLSGGEKSRVLLGKIIAKPCNLLLLDEPTHHLDMESIEALIDALEDFEGAVILVTHSELILKRLKFDKIVVAHKGDQELFLGDYEEFLEKDGWHDREEDQGFKKTVAKKEPVKQVQKSPQTLEREIAASESQIKKIEEDLKKLNEDLVQFIEKALSGKITETSKALADKQKALDLAHKSLDLLYEQL